MNYVNVIYHAPFTGVSEMLTRCILDTALSFCVYYCVEAAAVINYVNEIHYSSFAVQAYIL